MGRRDGQVKLRGFRIEVGEIESVLDGLAGVQESVVVVRAGPDGEKRLVGYVVGAGLDGAQVREVLGGLLPAFMVPSAIVVLDALPLSPSGKLDRSALPMPATWNDVGAPVTESEPPQTEHEVQIAAIWASVLHRDDIGRHVSFFALGGHSLLATLVVARLRAAFQVDMPLLAIFEHPTVASMAAYVVPLLSGIPNTVASGQIQRAARGDQDLSELVDLIEHLSEADMLSLINEDGSVSKD
jgi:hypothetical protein